MSQDLTLQVTKVNTGYYRLPYVTEVIMVIMHPPPGPKGQHIADIGNAGVHYYFKANFILFIQTLKLLMLLYALQLLLLLHLLKLLQQQLLVKLLLLVTTATI